MFAGQNATFNGKLTAANGYASAVALSCAAGTTAAPGTCSANPASVTPTGAGAAFTVTAAGAAQDYLFNVHAVGTDASTTTHDAAVTLHVVDFALGTPAPVERFGAAREHIPRHCLRGEWGGSVFRDGDAGVSGERDAGGGDVQLLAVGGGVGVAGDRDVDVYHDSIDAAGDYAHHDFGKHVGSTRCEDSKRKPDGYGTRGGLHAGDQQLAAVGDRQPVGDVQRHAEGGERLRERSEPDLRRGRAADLHGVADIGDADGSRGIFHGYGEEFAGADVQLQREWSWDRRGSRGAHGAGGFQFPVHHHGYQQHRAAEPEGWAERCLQPGRHARGSDDLSECREFFLRWTSGGSDLFFVPDC